MFGTIKFFKIQTKINFYGLLTLKELFEEHKIYKFEENDYFRVTFLNPRCLLGNWA